MYLLLICAYAFVWMILPIVPRTSRKSEPTDLRKGGRFRQWVRRNEPRLYLTLSSLLPAVAVIAFALTRYKAHIYRQAADHATTVMAWMGPHQRLQAMNVMGADILSALLIMGGGAAVGLGVRRLSKRLQAGPGPGIKANEVALMGLGVLLIVVSVRPIYNQQNWLIARSVHKMTSIGLLLHLSETGAIGTTPAARQAYMLTMLREASGAPPRIKITLPALPKAR